MSSDTNNLFQDVLTDVKGVEERLLGPAYPYWKNIKNPSEIGMSDNGSLKTLAKDVDGLVSYVELLVSGNSKASSTGKPLGNKFFLKTGSKCVNKSNNEEVDRYVYVNNVPMGNVPFISSGMGVNFSDFKGLIPGTISDLNVLNPFSIMQAFMAGANPPCQEVTLETININNVVGSETHFVTTIDLQNMDPCNFPGGKNPINGNQCKETFCNQCGGNEKKKRMRLPQDPIVQLYFASLGIVGIYILYKIMMKNR